MTREIIQAQYEQLDAVGQRFGSQSEQTAAMAARVNAAVQSLKNGGWEGRGAAAFFGEMERSIGPALQRLDAALREAQRVTLQIRQVVQAAEEDAARPFRERPVSATLASAGESGGRDQGELAVPLAPGAPGQPASGDGSGAHGAGGPATDADWQTHRTMSTAALLARLRGYDITASHMEHYLGNSGQPMRVDVNRMMNDMPEFRLAVEQQFRQDIWAVAQREINARYTGEPLQFQLTSDWRSDYYPSKKDYPDWYFGVGGFSYSQTAAVTVSPGPDGVPIVTIRSQVHMFDRYNWDAGKSVTLPSSGIQWIDDHTIAGDHIPDTSMGNLHQTGIAQEYELNGSSNTTVTQYRYDPAAGLADAPVPGTGGGR